jgi:hypothetical protein
MYHVVLVMLAFAIGVLGWYLVHSAPPIVSRILPGTLTFAIGAFLSLFGAFGGFLQGYYFRDGEGLVGCLVMIVVGLWFMLAPSSHNRGSYRDTLMLRKIFTLLALVFAVIIGSLYIPQDRVMAIVNLVVVTIAFWITTSYLRQVDSSR